MDAGGRPLSSTSKEEEEEEEEASSSSILRSSWWPRSSSTAAVAHLRCWFSCLPVRALFPSVSGRLVMLGIIAGVDQKGFFQFVEIPFVPQTQVLMVQTIQQTTEFLQLLYVSGWLCWLRCTSRCFLFPVRRPLMLGIMAGMDQKDSCCGMYEAGIDGYVAPRAVFVFPVLRTMMLGIMAVMDQKNTFSRLWSRQCKLSGSAAVPQLQFFEGRHHPCRGALASHGPDCSSDLRDSPVAREQGDRCPCYAVRASSTGRLHPCRDVEADPHGLVDHGDSSLASWTRWSMSCWAGGASFTGAVVEKTVVLPQLHLLRNSLRAAHELRWGFFRAVFTGTGPGAVSTGTRSP